MSDPRDQLMVYHSPADPEDVFMRVTVPRALRSYWVRVPDQVPSPVFAIERDIVVPVGAVVVPLHEAYGSGEW